MNHEQVGKYIRLLCLQHQKGRFTEKDMLSICKAYDEDVLSKFSKDKDGRYYNERLDKEMIKRQLYTESRRLNAKHPKKKEAYAEHMGNHMENENENINTIEVLEYKKFTQWIEKNAPNVMKMKEPFTKDQYQEVKKKFNKDVVKDVLTAMHNSAKLKNNISAYLTLCNWIKRRQDDPLPTSNGSHSPAAQSTFNPALKNKLN